MTLLSTKPPTSSLLFFMLLLLFFLLLWRHKKRLRLPLLNVNAFEVELIISRIVCVVLTTQLNCEAPLFVEDMFSFFQPNLMMIYCFHALSSRIVNLRGRLARPEPAQASGRAGLGRAGPGRTAPEQRGPGREARQLALLILRSSLLVPSSSILHPRQQHPASPCSGYPSSSHIPLGIPLGTPPSIWVPFLFTPRHPSSSLPLCIPSDSPPSTPFWAHFLLSPRVPHNPGAALQAPLHPLPSEHPSSPSRHPAVPSESPFLQLPLMPLVTELGFQSGLADTAGLLRVPRKFRSSGEARISRSRLPGGNLEMLHWMDRQTDRQSDAP